LNRFNCRSSSSCRLVRVLRPVVQAFVLPVLDARDDLLLRRPAADKLVGDHDARWAHLPFEQFPKQALGGLRIASALHQDIEHHPGLIYRTPEPVLYPGDSA
jgi:hypothetical protein